MCLRAGVESVEYGNFNFAISPSRERVYPYAFSSFGWENKDVAKIILINGKYFDKYRSKELPLTNDERKRART